MSLIETEARFEARARVSLLSANRCRSPLDFYARIGSAGAVLMESAAQGSPGGVRSLVVPEGLVRLEVRGTSAIFRGLSERAAPLLEALAAEGEGGGSAEGAVRWPLPERPSDPSLTDVERLQAPTALDAVRALAGLVVDRDPGSVRPGGVYGAFSFELVDRWEDLPARPEDPWNEPDVNVVLALDTVLFDHLSGEVRVITRALDPGEQDAADARHRAYIAALTGESPPDPRRRAALREKEAEPNVSDAAFLDGVRRFLRHIERGDIFQGVLSRSLSMRSAASPLDVYRALRTSNPSPYMFHLDLGEGGALFGASPETCLKVTGRRLEIRPIAGTAPRGLHANGAIDEELDSRLAVGLLLDPKEQAEHAMLVDLARNDVARVSVPGTRRVAEPFTIEKYSHVQHLVSGVCGELRPELDALHAYRAAANMGTLTGAPKLRAMELIRETEPFARGFYGGAVGYLLQDGSFDSCIVIRSLRSREGRYETRAGAGIVADSRARARARRNGTQGPRLSLCRRRGGGGYVSETATGRVLVLDNRDSFVFNLVDELLVMGARVDTLRSQIPLDRLEARLAALDPHLVVLSPGPGRPEEAGVMVEWLRTEPTVPVLGVCLGHQALAVAAGGEVGPAPRPIHGQADRVAIHQDDPVFADLGPRFVAARYHSLVVTRVPESMEVVATTERGRRRARDGDSRPERVPARAAVSPRVHPDPLRPPNSLALLRGSPKLRRTQMIPELIDQLLRGEPADPGRLEEALHCIMMGDVPQPQTAGLLVALRVREPDAPTLAACARAMRAHRLAVQTRGAAPRRHLRHGGRQDGNVQRVDGRRARRRRRRRRRRQARQPERLVEGGERRRSRGRAAWLSASDRRRRPRASTPPGSRFSSRPCSTRRWRTSRRFEKRSGCAPSSICSVLSRTQRSPSASSWASTIRA